MPRDDDDDDRVTLVPDPIDERPTPVPEGPGRSSDGPGESLPPLDLFADAEAALAKARAARGLPPERESERVERSAIDARDPFAAAEAALARAREARAPTRIGGKLAEARAQAELRRLKKEREEDDGTS